VGDHQPPPVKKTSELGWIIYDARSQGQPGYALFQSQVRNARSGGPSATSFEKNKEGWKDDRTDGPLREILNQEEVTGEKQLLQVVSSNPRYPLPVGSSRIHPTQSVPIFNTSHGGKWKKKS